MSAHSLQFWCMHQPNIVGKATFHSKWLKNHHEMQLCKHKTHLKKYAPFDKDDLPLVAADCVKVQLSTQILHGKTTVDMSFGLHLEILPLFLSYC